MSVLKNKQIIVVGSPGSGKSYMTKQIHLITGIPLYYMDCIYHKENWTHISKEELEEILTDIMKTDEWIIDGFYSRTLEMRLKVARTVVFLDIDKIYASNKKKQDEAKNEMTYLRFWLKKKIRSLRTLLRILELINVLGC